MRTLTLLLALSATAAAQPVDFRPVVLTGSDTPLLLGASVTAPVCYAYEGGAWAQCPIQIDERALLDRGSAYPPDDWQEFYNVDETYHYTAPQDYPTPGFTPYVPADPDPALDADDEVVLMARFFGEQADLAASPPPYAPENVQEVAFEGRYVYLYAPTTPLDQSAGYDLVSYDFNLLAGEGRFPEDYDFSSDHYSQYMNQGYSIGDHLGANPEYSIVQSPYYRTVFEDRWIQRELQFADDQGTLGPDILDRVKFASRPDYPGAKTGCGRTIWTGSSARGTLGIQKNGPVRAIRFIQGYNSGGYNNVTYLLYERYMEFRMQHAMHNTPGASMWYDLEPAATGMTYYSNIYPAGVTIDGTPDYPAEGEFPDAYIDWDYLIGDQGSMVGVWEKDTNIDFLVPKSYYDDASPANIINCSGDGVAIGNFGNVVYEHTAKNPKVPSTDPREPQAYLANGDLRYLTLARRAVFAGPNLPQADADALVADLQAPVLVTVADLPVPAGDFVAPTLSGALDRAAQTFSGSASDAGSGVASVALAAGATNLSLTVDAFSAGAASVAFTATPTDPGLAGSGYVVATDVEGNADSLFVDVPVPAPDVLAPELAGTATLTDYTGTATDDRLDDSGVASVTLSADATNLALAVDPFTPGAASASFTASLTDSELAGSGYVVATDVAGNADSVFVSFEPVVDDEAPVIAGSASGTTYSGTATDDRPTDSGVASVALAADATNLTLAVDPFSAGAASVAFTASSTDRFQAASGYVIATDVEGNADSVLVSLDALVDEAAPVLAGSASGTTYSGTATDDRVADTGVASVALAAGATNLTLAVDPFAAGAASVAFTASLTDGEQAGSGYVVATDVAGNADSVLVSLDPAPQHQYDLAAEAAYAFTNDTDGTITVTARNIGSDPMTSVRVKLQSSSAVSISQSNISLGQIDPGAAKDAVFSFTGAGTGATATFQVQDLVVRHGEGDTANNDVTVALEPNLVDETGPVLSGALVDDGAGRRYEGTATDDGPADTGVAAVALAAGATNLTLDVDPFTAGDASVAFTATPIDPALDASGTVEATDVEGNTSTLAVEILAPAPDTAAPVLSGSAAGATYSGTATDDGLDDSGVASVALAAGATNLTLAVDPFSAGAASVAFTASLTDGEQAGSGYVVATDVAGNADSVLVSLEPVVDTEAPILTGSYGARSFDGTATDDRATDTGLASVVLQNATNLSLDVAAFDPGAPSTTFSVSLIDIRQPGEGTVVATDLAGNESTLFVSSANSNRSAATSEATSDGAAREASAAEASASEGEASANTESPDDRADELGRLNDGAESTEKAEAPAKGAARGRPDRSEAPSLEEEALVEDEARGSATEASASVTAASTEAAPDGFGLSLYPNPFTAAATLRFYVHEAGPVDLRVYDLTGHAVRVVLDRPLSEGWHAVPFAAGDLASGIYVWRIASSGALETGRFTVLK